MSIQLSERGAASDDLAAEAARNWQDAADRQGIPLEGFDPTSPFDERIAWALQSGLTIATVYVRFSSNAQHSTFDQIRECQNWAAQHDLYVPPELICVDEAVTGKRIRRDGLERMKSLLKSRQATVLLVYKASRLFRQAGKGFQLIQEEVVEEGLRAVSVSQGIDTDDKKSWKIQMQVHGLVDDMLIDAIGDHVRSGLTGLHLKGWTTGAIGVGYRRKELPDEPATNRGLPRTIPEIDPEVAELIRQHARWHLDGMSLAEGLRRWRDSNGPCDPRATTGRMNYPAYRRLWSNIRLTGRWEFGRKRNQFSTKRDYIRQVEQPDDEVATIQLEDLRILDDETFLALQVWLDKKKQGPRGPRKKKRIQLWDVATDVFYCTHCSQPDAPVRYYTTGANGSSMQCKNGDRCPCKSSVDRKQAVLAVCRELPDLIARDAALIEDVVCRSRELDSTGDAALLRDLADGERSNDRLTRQLADLYELAGNGSEIDRREVQARIRAAQAERSTVQLELARLKKAQAASSSTLSPEDVRRMLKDSASLLEDAAAGKLGEEGVYRALGVFRRLTGGQILMHVERRPGRKRTIVRGVFRPRLIAAATSDPTVPAEELPDDELSVWIRKPPRMDAIAERVHQLIDDEGLSFRDAAKQLQQEGHDVNSGNVWYSYHRWYEMQGLPKPKLPYNNGHRRCSA